MSLNATVTGPLPDFWERAYALPFQKVQLPEPRDSSARWLTAVERATVKVCAPRYLDAPIGNSILHEATVRLSIFQSNGLLEHMSGQYLADALNRIFWTPPSRYARRGWILLAAIDAADLAQISLSAEPDPADVLQRFRRMRLHERLEEYRAKQREDEI